MIAMLESRTNNTDRLFDSISKQNENQAATRETTYALPAIEGLTKTLFLNLVLFMNI